MYLRVAQGAVRDRQRLRTGLDRMVAALTGQGHGWLGTTAGTTDDGTAVVVTRWEDEVAPAADERTPWWDTVVGAFDQQPAVHRYRVVLEQLRGNPHDAGFVQVLQGRILDVDRTEHLLEDVSGWQQRARPDLIGGVLGLHLDGGFTQVAYFTSEVEARAGERTAWPHQLEELDPLVQHSHYLDLREPWMYAPRSAAG